MKANSPSGFEKWELITVPVDFNGSLCASHPCESHPEMLSRYVSLKIYNLSNKVLFLKSTLRSENA